MNATITPITPITPISTISTISRRDRAVLCAVAAGRATVRGGVLLIDGRFSADQFALGRLAAAGLVATAAGTARLTTAGGHALRAA